MYQFFKVYIVCLFQEDFREHLPHVKYVYIHMSNSYQSCIFNKWNFIGSFFLNYLSIKLFKKTWITPSGKIVSLWLLISVSSLSHVCKMFNLHYIISIVPCSCSILRFYLHNMVNSNTTKSKVKMKTDLVRESSQRNLVYCEYRECTKKATS